MRLSALVSAVALAALVAVSAPAVRPAAARAADPPLVLTDPKGDALDGRGSMDIVGLRFEVKVLRAGQPPSLVVSLTLAAPPEQQAAQYLVSGEIPDCGSFQFAYRPGTVYSRLPGTGPMQLFICDDADDTGTRLTFTRSENKGSTLSWQVAVDSLPKSARRGGRLTGITAVSSLADPALGIFGNGYTDTGVDGVPTDDLVTPREFAFA